MSLDEQFAQYMDTLKNNSTAMLAFQNDPVAALKAENFPFVQAIGDAPESITLPLIIENLPSDTSNLDHDIDNLLEKLFDPDFVDSVEITAVNPELESVVEMVAVASSGDTEHIDVQKHWWGYDIIMNEKLSSDIVNGLGVLSTLTSWTGSALVAAGVVATSVATPIAAVIAGSFLLKKFQIQVVDKGNGVHWPVTWIQHQFIMSQTLLLGPVGAIGSVLAVVHPFRNS